jgi:REP element-mobilizing transposase RayT
MPQSYSRTFYHFVWATWDRAPILLGDVERHAYALIQQQCGKLGCTVHALGGIQDHVHLVVSLPRTLCIADFMEGVKGGSSRALNETALEQGEGFKWQGGYGVLTVSQSDLRRVVAHAERQKEHHQEGTLWPGSERVWEEDV